MGREARTLVFICAFVAVALPGVAFGQNAVLERAIVMLPSCDALPFEREIFLSVLKLELASHDVALSPPGVTVERSPTDAGVVIRVGRCSRTAESVEIEVDHSGTAAKASRSVVFTLDDRNRRARVLALATATFVTVKWPTLAGPEPPDPDKARIAALEARIAELEGNTSGSAPETPVAVARVPIPRWLFGVGAGADLFLEFSTAAFGPTVWASRRLHDHVRLQFSATSGFGRSRALTGNIKVRTVVGSTAVLFGGGDRVWLGVGPRLSFGWARLRGDAFDALTLAITEATLTKATGSASLQFALRAQLTGRWWAFFDAYGGYGFPRLEGDTDDGVRGGVGGSFVSVAFGIAVHLGAK